MNIVYLAEVMGIGGLPNYVLDLARSYEATHPDTSIIIAHMGEKVGANLEFGNLRVERVRTVEDIAALEPDIVHVHLLSDIKILEGLFTLGVPLVRFFHDYTSTCLRRGKRRWPGDRCQRALSLSCAGFGCMISPPREGGKLPVLSNLLDKIKERNLYRRFDATITGSNHMSGMLRINGFPPERVHMIPYFTRYAPDACIKRDFVPFPRKMNFLFTGQAVKGKGLEILISALEGLQGDWHLTVFSEGPRLESAKEIATRIGVSDKISFRGWVKPSELYKSYKQADLFILPSIWDDPGPLVGIEAMALGTPVIGFDVGGVSDYVIEGKTGVLVRDTNVKGLHKALQDCLNHPEKIKPMGTASQHMIATERTPAIHLAGVHEIYTNILKNCRGKKAA